MSLFGSHLPNFDEIFIPKWSCKDILKPGLHGQFLCDNFYVANVFDRADGTTIICQQLKVNCASNDLGQQRYASTVRSGRVGD